MASDPQTTPRPRVLILGAGFAGLGAARKLRKAPVEVVLVDRHDYHTFQPMLYQVATDLLDPETVGHPVREYVDNQPNLRFVTAGVGASWHRWRLDYYFTFFSDTFETQRTGTDFGTLSISYSF